MSCARFWRLAALCCGAWFAAPVAAADAPFSITLEFHFFYNGIKAANVREVFSTDADGGYAIVSRAEAVGLAKLLYGDVFRKSEGQIDRLDGLRVTEYEEKRGPRPRTAMRADEKTRTLHLQKGEEQRTEKFSGDVPLVDYLTGLYRRHILGTAESGDVMATDGWRLKIYTYEEGAPEMVATTTGEVRAVPLLRESPRGRRIFWLAPSLRYLPVRMIVEDKGHTFETVIDKINGAPVGD